MKVKKRWQENIVKFKLTHLRQYFLRTYIYPTAKDFHRNNVVLPRLDSLCNQLKKSMKFLHECKFRGHKVFLVKVFPSSVLPNSLNKSSDSSSKEILNIAAAFDVVAVLTPEALSRKYSRLKPKSSVSVTYFYNMNNSFPEKYSGIFVDNAAISFHQSMLKKILSK